MSDVGRFNDKGFNQLSLQGCKAGAKKVGGTCRGLESRSTSDYIPNFTKLIRDGANISIATGFLLADGTATVAKKFPKSTVRDRRLLGPRRAVREQEGQAAVQERRRAHVRDEREQLHDRLPLAALMAKRAGGNTISATGGINIPTVTIFIAAYRAGATKCVQGTKTLIDFSADFVDQAKCKELALNHIDAGSKVEFAGRRWLRPRCARRGEGERRSGAIGVDKDQSFLGPHILTSAVKRVDRAVKLRHRGEDLGLYPGGTDLNFNLKNNGVAIGKISQGRAEGVHREDERPRRADHRRQDQAADDALGTTSHDDSLRGRATARPRSLRDTCVGTDRRIATR